MDEPPSKKPRLQEETDESTESQPGPSHVNDVEVADGIEPPPTGPSRAVPTLQLNDVEAADGNEVTPLKVSTYRQQTPPDTSNIVYYTWALRNNDEWGELVTSSPVQFFTYHACVVDGVTEKARRQDTLGQPLCITVEKFECKKPTPTAFIKLIIQWMVMATINKLQNTGPCSACEHNEPAQEGHTYPGGCLESVDSALSTYGNILLPHPAHVVNVYAKAMKKINIVASPFALFAAQLTLELYNTKTMTVDIDDRIHVFDNLFATVY